MPGCPQARARLAFFDGPPASRTGLIPNLGGGGHVLQPVLALQFPRRRQLPAGPAPGRAHQRAAHALGDGAQPRVRPDRRAGPAVAVQGDPRGRDVLRRGHPRHPVHAAAVLHLLRAARVRHQDRRVRHGGDRAHRELLGVPVRGLPGGDPGGGEGPGRGGAVARAVAGEDDAPRDPAAGAPHRGAAARQLLHLAVQGHRAGVDHHGEGADLHRSDHRGDQLPVLHHLHDRRDDLPRAVLSGIARRAVPRAAHADRIPAAPGCRFSRSAAQGAA